MKTRLINLAWLLLATLAATSLVSAHPAPFAGDVAVARWVQDTLGAAWLPAAAAVLGALPWMAGAAVLVAFAARGWRAGAFLAGACALSWFVVEPVFKAWAQRPRPTPDLIAVLDVRPGYGYPSGGALHVAVIVLTLLVLLGARRAPRRMPAAALALGATVILAVGTARVAAGAHWPSDVVAAWLMAGAVASLTGVLYQLTYSLVQKPVVPTSTWPVSKRSR
jgi:undecaprenyl-diphosphatase